MEFGNAGLMLTDRCNARGTLCCSGQEDCCSGQEDCCSPRKTLDKKER